MHGASIALSDSLKEEDMLTWTDSPDHIFVVPSAYMSACESEVNTPWKGWDHI